jgi:pimeloyl-ACP methyl ester carboxylesterase
VVETAPPAPAQAPAQAAIPVEKVPKVAEGKSRVPTEKKPATTPVVTKATPADVLHEDIDANDEGYFNGFSGTQLYYQAWSVEGAKSAVIFVHGLGDHSGSYKHLINHVVPGGYSVYSFDLRGHGRSQGEKGHVGEWNEYREDLRLFINVVKKEENVRRVFLAGFDLGALVTLEYSIRYKTAIQGNSDQLITHFLIYNRCRCLVSSLGTIEQFWSSCILG